MLEGHSLVAYCDNDCTIKEGWICFEDASKPCVKDCPEDEKPHGKYVSLKDEDLDAEVLPDEIKPDEPEDALDIPAEGDNSEPEQGTIIAEDGTEMEFVEGRGVEPKCSIPDFGSESFGIDNFRISGDTNQFISKTSSYDDVDTATVLAGTPVDGALKLQFKVKSWVKWLEIGFATESQWDNYYIGHDNVGFAYNVFTDAESTGYWYGENQASSTEYIH